MARPANQTSGSGDTNKPGKKPPAKKPPKTDPNAPPLYSWNGGPKTHTVSQADHEMHVQDPLTRDPLYASAKQQATAQYAPQVNALNTLQTNAPAWYRSYMDQARASAAASQKYSQPVIDQAGTFATNINTPAAGLDPNSPEYARSQQAGKGLSALAQFGVQNLQGNQAADQTYFGGQATNAAGALPGVLAGYATQQGQLGSQVAGKTQELYQGLKQAAVNEDIARTTLGVNAADKAADNTRADVTAAQTAADRKASRVVSRKNTRDRITAQTDRQAAADAEKTRKQAEKDAAAKTKKSAAVKKAVGKVQNQFSDINDYGGGLVGKDTDDTTKPKDPKTGQYPARKITKADADAAVRTKYGMKGRIALAIRDGRPLDQAAQDYLHRLDPNFRIPREWIAGRRTTVSRPGSAPSNTPGQYRPT